MADLLTRFIQDMQLRNFSESTIRSYSFAVKQLAEHFNKSPQCITEEEIKEYFLYNRNVKHWSRAAFSVAISGIKFFFEKTLQKQWHVFGLVRPPRDKSLPEILSLKEVNKIFSCVKMEHHKICLKTIYSLGLRIQEGTRLQVGDIESPLKKPAGRPTSIKRYPCIISDIPMPCTFWKPVWIFDMFSNTLVTKTRRQPLFTPN